jgi:hypothetical protein
MVQTEVVDLHLTLLMLLLMFLWVFAIVVDMCELPEAANVHGNSSSGRQFLVPCRGGAKKRCEGSESCSMNKRINLLGFTFSPTS